MGCCNCNKHNEMENQLDLLSAKEKQEQERTFNSDDEKLPSTRCKDIYEYFQTKESFDISNKSYDLPLQIEKENQINQKNFCRLTFDPQNSGNIKKAEHKIDYQQKPQNQLPFKLIVDVQKVDTPKFTDNKNLQDISQISVKKEPTIKEEVSEEFTDN